MFKPEYILDDVALFGRLETLKLLAAKFERMGKSPWMASSMASALLAATLAKPYV